MNIDPKIIKTYFRAQRDFLFFCKDVLGYVRNDDYGYTDLVPEHEELAQFLSTKDQYKLILMPRETYKSAICTAAYPLWELVKNPNLRILIYSDSATKAQGFLQDIKNHIEGRAPNSKFRDFYPGWETDPHKGKWNESEIVVSERKVAMREPSIDTGGIESSKVGKHYDIIIMDDVVSDLNVTTKAQMDKVHEHYKKALSLLKKKGGKLIIVGTRWHYGDLYGRIIENNKERSNFKILIKDAEEERGGKPIFHDIGLTRDYLQHIKTEQGSYLYSSLYRNHPVDDETAIFKIDNFSFYEPSPHLHENMFITGTCDPAGEGEDSTAITVVGTDKDKNMYILDAINESLTPSQIIDQIIRLNYKWGFSRFSVERNFFKGMLEREFRETEAVHLKNENYKPFSFSEDVIASSKQRNSIRVLSLQPFHERKAIKFPGKSILTLSGAYAELASQMQQFSSTQLRCMGPHDDLLVSLAFHVEIIVRGGEAQEEGFPETSAAWFEDNLIESLQNSRVPSMYKPKIERVLSGV